MPRPKKGNPPIQSLADSIVASADPAATLAAIIALVQGGQGIASKPTRSAGVRPGTVAELVPAFLKQLDVKPKTVIGYRCGLGWLVAEFGAMGVAELDGDAVAERLRSSGRKPNTRRQMLIMAGAFVRWCRRDDFKTRKPPAESRGDEFLLTPDEMRRLLAASSGDFSPFLKTLWLSGCRPSEARVLSTENVNWSAGVAVLREHKTSKKTGKPRVIPLSDEALAVLEVQRAKYGGGPLFRSSRGNPLTRWATDRLMARAKEKAGVRKSVILYGYRHTFAATLVRRGEPTAKVATILGHTSSKLVESCYGHLGSDMQGLRSVAGRLDTAG